MDHKLLLAIFKKGHSYIITEGPVNSVKNTSIQSKIIYKPGPDLFMADWIPRQFHKAYYKKMYQS